MRMLPSITKAELREICRYDSETGIFIRRRNTCGALAGEEMGRKNKSGYKVIYIKNKPYPARSLAWLYITGELTRSLKFVDKDSTNIRFNNIVKRERTAMNLEHEVMGQESEDQLTINHEGNFVGTFLDPNINKWRYRYVMKNGHVVFSNGYADRNCAIEQLNELFKVLKLGRQQVIKCCN